MCAQYGRRTTTSPQSGIISAGTARATVYDTMPENGWAYEIGMHAGRNTGNVPSARLHVWNANSGSPGAVVANTGVVSVTNQLHSGASTGVVSGLTTAVTALSSGSRYAIGMSSVGGQTLHGLHPVPAGGDMILYTRAATSTGILNPYNHTGTIHAGWMTAWVEYEPNVAPTAPNFRNPHGLIDGTPSTFEGRFNDANLTVQGRANANERMSQYRIQLREVGSGTLLWNSTYTASASERNNRTFLRAPIASLALEPAVDYEWRCQVSDAFGAWSPWSSWLAFTINAAGSVTPDSNPGVTGRQTTQTPSGFRINYTHADDLNGNRREIRLHDDSGNVVRDPQGGNATIPSSGAYTINPNWTNWTDLPWGRQWAWSVRVRDTNDEWSGWSEPHGFWTNYPPTVPAQLQPSGGEIVSGFPELTFTMSDPDNTPDEMSVFAQIYDSDNSLLFTRIATNVGGNQWSYQTTAADLPENGTYYWRAYGRDDVSSNRFSSQVDFFYAEAPNVTSPGQDAALTSTTIALAWETSGQVRRRMRLFEAGTTMPIFTSGWVTTSNQHVNMGLGAFIENGEPYELILDIELEDQIVTSSERVRFTVYLEGSHWASVWNGQSNAVAVGSEQEPTAIQIRRYGSSGVTSNNFQEWRIKEGSPSWRDRWDALQADLPSDPGEAVRAQVELANELETVAVSRSFNETIMMYYEPRLNETRVYVLTAVIQTGINTVESLPYTWLGETGVLLNCDTTQIVLHDPQDPSGRRVLLRHLSSGNFSDERNQTTVETWADGPPLIIESGLSHLVMSNTYELLPGDSYSPLESYERLRSLRDVRGDDTPILITYRDDLGQRLTVRITSLSAARHRMGRLEATVEFTEVRNE